MRQLPDCQENIIYYLAYIYKVSGNYDEAIHFFTDALETFTDYQYEITNSLAGIYLANNEYEKCLDIWEFGIQKEFFYLIFPERQEYEPLK